MKIKLPEILAALFLCLCDINPQISVYGLSERNYYNGVLYRQKDGSNLDTRNTPRYLTNRIISRIARDPSDSDTDHTTHSEAYLHDQRSSTVTKLREYKSLTKNKIKIRERRCPDTFSEKGEPSFKAVIGFEKQSLSLEINGFSPQCSSICKQVATTEEFKTMPAVSYSKSTNHHTRRCTTTEKIASPVYEPIQITEICEQTTRPGSICSAVKAVIHRIGSHTTLVFRVPSTQCPLRLKVGRPLGPLLTEVAIAPSKERNMFSPVRLDAGALATIQSLLEKFQRFSANHTLDDTVSNQTVNETVTHQESNFTTHTNQEQSDRREIKVSPTSYSTINSTYQEGSSEKIHYKISNSEFIDKPEGITEQYHEAVNNTSPV